MKRNWTLQTENEILVYSIFQKIRINFRLKSTKYLFKAMLIYLDKPNLNFTTGIYPIIANEFNINAKSLNTMLSSAIKCVWKSCSLEAKKELTDHPLFIEQGKIPTNKEFFFMVRRWVIKNKKK